MTNIEKIEATLKKVADTQLVHARLMETNERKWDKRFENLQGLVKNHEGRVENLERGAQHLLRATDKLWRVAEAHEGRLDNLVRVAEAHEQRFDSLHDEVRTMVASVARLIKMIEDFAKGRKRQNGHR